MALPFAGLGLPEQTLGWFPQARFGQIGPGIVVEDNLLNYHAGKLS